MDKKWTIGLGLLGILIVFLLLWNFAPATLSLIHI